MRSLTDVERNATIVSLYQAGNGIYDLFDKVTVIAEGRVIYYGPRTQAQGYFEDMGFECHPGANVADFLTAVTATNERKIKDGFEHVPTSSAEFAMAYQKSDIAKRMKEEVDAHLSDVKAREKETAMTQESINLQKHRFAPKGRSERVSYAGQVRAAMRRDYQQRWGDQW